MQLCGKAYNLTKHRLIESWDELKTLLEEIFSDKRSQGQWEMELHSCKQSNQEKVIDFANRVESAMIKLINCVTIGVDGQIATNYETLMRNQAKNVFLIGLKELLNILVKSQNPATLEVLSMEQVKFCRYCKKKGHLLEECRPV